MRLMALTAFARLLVLLLVHVACVTTSLASVATITLEELVSWSPNILVGRIERIQEVESIRIARVVVMETIKGPAMPELYFYAQPSWTCDISGGEEGESYLLFLAPHHFDPSPDASVADGQASVDYSYGFRDPPGFEAAVRKATGGAQLFGIVHSGRGQMGMRTLGEQSYFTVWTGSVRLPRGMASIDDPERSSTSIRSVPADDLLRFVRRRMRAVSADR